MLVLLLVLLAAAAVCARLGVWQLERAQLRATQNEREVVALREDAVPIDDVLAPQTTFDGDLLGRQVSVTGTYDADAQLVVADRALEGRTGWVVLTPLRVSGGVGDGAVLPVARGWVASPDAAAAPPAGTVSLTGYLQPSEAAGALDTAAATAESISTAQLVNIWGGPIYSGYLVLTSSTPAQDGALEILPAPQPRGGGGWDLRNLGYALQWWIFGLFAVALWVRLVRDEAAGDTVLDDEAAGGEPGSVVAVPEEGPDGGTRGTVREPAGGASA
jgi:cytochrome oxidase assembly protein ShyY1